ncbi:hypothetical protein [Spiroplasma endosymbiont of Dioctria linearis]|uniref:hypothetical protein n=1 Tax=Spiroplasma endosymbiont of Dioctria linearis TaxID=3066290 RepID=UPI00313AE278
MKKIFLLLSINSILFPSLYTISCSSFYPYSGGEAPLLKDFTLINYSINKYNSPDEERNFISFLRTGGTAYNNEFSMGGVSEITYKDPETMKARATNEHLVHIKEIEKFNYDVYKFELSIYTSQIGGKFLWVESRQFEVKMIYDLENSEAKKIVKNYQFFIKDFIGINILTITYKKFFDSFELYIKDLASEYFLNKFKTDFDILNTSIDNINLWDRYGEIIRNTSNEKYIYLKDDDYFYLKSLDFKKENEINNNSRFWGNLYFSKYPGEPEIPPEPNIIDVSDVVIKDIESYKQINVLFFIFRQKTMPPDISKIISDSIKEQKQINDANINWKDNRNFFLCFDKYGKNYFSSEEDMQAYFDSGETEIELYLGISEHNNNPELVGEIRININCDKK